MKQFLAIFAFIAFLNPLCCCSAAWMWADEAQNQAPVHSCCSSEVPADSENVPSAPEHDPANCPHRANKSFHDGAAHEFELPVMEFAVAPRLLEVVDLQLWLDARAYRTAIPEGRQNLAPPPSTQVYCVYMI